MPRSSRPHHLARCAVVVAALLIVPTPLLAGEAYRFTGSVVRSIGSTRLVDLRYDRSDAGGQGGVEFHLFPPESDESRNIRAISSAGPGYLSASAHADFTKETPGGFNATENVSGGSFARVDWDDVVVSGPPGPVAVAINTHIDGSILIGAPAQATAAASALVSFYYNSDNIGGGVYGSNVYLGTVYTNITGVFTTFPASAILISPVFVVPANTPLRIGISLSANASVSAPLNAGSNPAANTDFGHTLTLATDRPVFTVPAGYTVNSVQAGIINNSFKRPCPADLNADGVVD
ncbi:MAG: hypothetical protein ACK58T_33920, partial [Phycisphaerae bacterium]